MMMIVLLLMSVTFLLHECKLKLEVSPTTYVGNGRCVLHISNSSTLSMSLDHAALFLVNHACMSAFLDDWVGHLSSCTL